MLVYGRKPNHVLHLLLTVLTCGLWLLVWSWAGVLGKERRVMVSVDEQGAVQTRKLGRR